MKKTAEKNQGQDIFQQNLAAIKDRFPEVYRQIDGLSDDRPIPVEGFVNAYGQVNARYVFPDGKRVLFHEAENIVEHFERQFDHWHLENRDFLCCIGMGLGYLPLIASQHLESQPGIVIFEPNPAIMKLAFEKVDLQPLLRYPKLHLVLGTDESIRDQLLRFKDSLFFGKIKLVSHGASGCFFGETFEQFEKSVADNIKVIRNICYTAREEGPRILTNTMANLPSLFGGPDLGRLRDLLHGFPAICVAAGPSLDKDLALLRSIGDRAAILCCDSAVHALVSAGITPHLVVTADRLPVNFEKIRYDIQHLRDSVLVFGAEANPDNVSAFLSPRRFAVSADSVLLNRWLGPQLGLDWQLPAMTSVSHNAIFTAVKLGADPIVLVGMDFALSDGSSHARGSIFRYSANSNTEISVEGVKGLSVKALPQLVTDRRQIENVVANHRMRLIDVSLSGALVRGTEIRSLQEIVDTMLNPQGGVFQRLNSVDWAPCAGSTEVIPVMRKMLNTLKRFNDGCRQSKRGCRRCITNREPSLKDTHKIRNDLARFEQQHELLMRVLQMLRYADVQTLTARMEELTNVRNQFHDANHGLKEEVDIYADHYESLEKAGCQFETLLKDRIAYFKKEAAIASRLSGAAPQDGKSIALAEHYRGAGELWRSESIYQRRLKDFPNDTKAWLALGQQYVDKQLWYLASELLGKWKKRCSDDETSALFEERMQRKMASILEDASNSLASGNTEVARRRLLEYLRLFPGDTIALELQNRLHQLTEDDAEPKANSQGISLTPVEEEALLAKVHKYLHNAQPEPAIGILEGLAQALPEQAARFRERIGDIRFEQRDFASAAWHYRISLATAPGSSSLETKLLDAERFQVKAIGGLNTSETVQASMANAPTPDDLYRRSREWIGTGDTPKAIRALEQILAVNPDDAQVHNDLGVLYFNQGDSEKAYTHYQQSTLLDPDNPTYQKKMANFVYIARGNVKAALEIYVKLLNDHPEDIEILSSLGQICANERQYDDAEFFLRRALEIDPDNDSVQRSMTELFSFTQRSI